MICAAQKYWYKILRDFLTCMETKDYEGLVDLVAKLKLLG